MATTSRPILSLKGPLPPRYRAASIPQEHKWVNRQLREARPSAASRRLPEPQHVRPCPDAFTPVYPGEEP
jgi:hypothetical protein